LYNYFDTLYNYSDILYNYSDILYNYFDILYKYSDVLYKHYDILYKYKNIREPENPYEYKKNKSFIFVQWFSTQRMDRIVWERHVRPVVTLENTVLKRDW
jgi:hypothetical protein